MKITVINPNTTASMTATIGEAARGVAAAGTEITAVNPSFGPVSIESHYDDTFAALGVIEQVQLGEQAGADGYVIACFGDPGLEAARELAHGPVVGIAEAAMHTASLVGRSFAVVTTLARTLGLAHDLADRYGLANRCSAMTACDVPVLELDIPGSDARHRVIEECRTVLATTDADTIVLGCAGMADFVAEVERAIQVPVIDGVAAAVKHVEGLVSLGLTTSRLNEYAHPLPKPIVGRMQDFTLS